MSPDKLAKLRTTTTVQFEEHQYLGLHKMASVQKTSIAFQIRRAIDEYLLSQGYLKTLDK